MLVAATLLLFVVVSALVAFRAWPDSGLSEAVSDLFVDDGPAALTVDGPAQVALDAAAAAAAVGAAAAPRIRGGRGSRRWSQWNGARRPARHDRPRWERAAERDRRAAHHPPPRLAFRPRARAAGVAAVPRRHPGSGVGGVRRGLGDTTQGVTDGLGQTVGGVNPDLGKTVTDTGEALSDLVRGVGD